MRLAYVTTGVRKDGRIFSAISKINLRTNETLSVTPIVQRRLFGISSVVVTSKGIAYALAQSNSSTRPSRLFVVDTNTERVIKRISLGTGAILHGIVLTPNENRVWLTDVGQNSVKVLNTHTNQIIHDIRLPMPSYIAVTPDGKFMWIATQRGIQIIRTRTKQVVGFIQVPVGPIAFSPSGGRAYTGSLNNPRIRVAVIDVENRRVIETIKNSGTGHIDNIQLTSDGKRMFLNTEGTLTVVDTRTNRVVDLNLNIIFNTVDDHQLFSLPASGIVIRNTNTLKVVKTIPIPGGALGITVKRTRA